MGEQVRVTSVEALESFRASCIIFLTKARQSLDTTSEEVRRTRDWVLNDQKFHWEGQLKRRRRVLDQAQGELMSARMSEFIDSPSVQQAAVRKAKLAVEEAESKLLTIKKWSLNFDTAFEPLIKRMEGLRHLLDQDLPKAVVYLDQAQRTLISYAEIHTPTEAAAIAAESGNTGTGSDSSPSAS